MVAEFLAIALARPGIRRCGCWNWPNYKSPLDAATWQITAIHLDGDYLVFSAMRTAGRAEQLVRRQSRLRPWDDSSLYLEILEGVGNPEVLRVRGKIGVAAVVACPL